MSFVRDMAPELSVLMFLILMSGVLLLTYVLSVRTRAVGCRADQCF